VTGFLAVRDRPAGEPASVPGLAGAGPELAVLAAFTGAVDLEQDAGRRQVLGTLAAARLDEERLEIYTHLIRAVASAAARSALEALMTTAFKDEFIDRIKAEGRAEGEALGRTEGEVKGRADMLLRILAARGLEVPDPVRERVLSCTDLGQLDAWGDSAVTATTLDEVFPG
jgi:predicted transposase YdaD